MPVMRTLYVHAGAGKTGTSALQLFFDGHRRWLAEQGIHYPAGPHGIDPRTKISSGNGWWLYRFLLEGEDWGHFQTQLRSAGDAGHVLISSELLAGARPQHLEALREEVRRLGFRLDCFYLVRNPDEWYLSAYQQHVKRHGFSDCFSTFCQDYRFEFTIPLANYESVLGEGALRLLSYEAGKSDIISYVLRQGLGLSSVPPPHDNPQINRSLTRFELEVLRLSNVALKASGMPEEVIDARGARTSNLLIAARPKVPPKARYRESMPGAVVERLRPAVDAINARLEPDASIRFASSPDSEGLTNKERRAASALALMLAQAYRTEELARRGVAGTRARLPQRASRRSR